MKYFIIGLLFISAAINLEATDFLNHWTKAVEYCDEKKFEEAEECFTTCINVASDEEMNNHPHIYVDRARLFILLENYDEALEDLNIALENDNLVDEDRCRGIMSRISVYMKLDRVDDALVDYQKLKPLFPKIEHTENSIIIRNIPESEFYKKVVTSFYVDSGICKSESDIKIFDSGILIAKKNKCCCGCGTNPYLNANVDTCKYGCDKIALMANTWCGGFFRKKRCQLLCALAVDTINDGCKWCCSSGSIYEKCVQPFNHILERMGNGCDPAWD